MKSTYEWADENYHWNNHDFKERKKQRNLSTTITQAEWYQLCDLGDLLIKQICYIPNLKNYKQQIANIANRITERAVREHCLGCGFEKAELWAKKWLSYENRNFDFLFNMAGCYSPGVNMALKACWHTNEGEMHDYYVSDSNYLKIGNYIERISSFVIDYYKEIGNKELEMERRLQAIDVKSEIPKWIWETN